MSIPRHGIMQLHCPVKLKLERCQNTLYYACSFLKAVMFPVVVLPIGFFIAILQTERGGNRMESDSTHSLEPDGPRRGLIADIGFYSAAVKAKFTSYMQCYSH